MRLFFTSSSFLLATLATTNAFVPVRQHATTNTALHAGRVVPPPPPPPPQDDGGALGNLLQKLQSSTADLQERAASSGGSRLELPKLELPDFSLPNLNINLDGWSDLLPLQQVQQSLGDLEPFLQQQYPELLPAYQSFLTTLSQSLDSPLAPAAAILVSTLVIQSLLNPFGGMGPDQPYPAGRYDPVSAKLYFDRRPRLVAARGVTVVAQSLVFAAKVLGDVLSERNGHGLAEEEQEARGQELAALLCTLGSTYIKVGQSLSIRTDILSPPYIRGLQTLQDQVPPFDSARAFDMIEAEWGRPLDQIVSEITDVPVASASLGQVYKATLQDNGREVAIKIQRPEIMENIALDMYLLREYIATFAKQVGNLNSDTVGTVDAWGLGFVDELNYIQEAKNSQFFSEEIGKTSLKDVVFSPVVVEEYSTNQVLVTEWVDGERLDKSSKEDVTTLCSIAMNTYLTMLLEIGVLHCDPHPGNLLRTPEGKLCVLDWGMITELDSDLQLTLIEHMAHLTSADYEEIPKDLLLLGFIPEDKKHLINDSGVVELLAGIYGTWTAGGGVAAFNVNDVINELQELTAKKGNLFQIPPYFAYIAKSFSVLEGIGLSNDPKYSIVNECLPYVSQRLLMDSTNMESALNTFIFGPEKKNEDRIVDYDRVEQLVNGFGNYTTSASGARLGKEDMSRADVLEGATDQILDLVFTEEETPLQDILLEQLAKITAASSRSIWTELRERSGTLANGRSLLGTLVDPIGLFRSSPLVRMNDMDVKTVDTTRRLLALAQEQTRASNSASPDFDLSKLSTEEVVQVSSMLVRKVWSKRAGVLSTSGRFAQKLLLLTADKLERGERIAPSTNKLSSLDRPFPAPTEINHLIDTPDDLIDPTFTIDKPVRTTPRVEISREKQRSGRKPVQLSSAPKREPVPAVSSRLESARQRLDQLENEDY